MKTNDTNWFIEIVIHLCQQGFQIRVTTNTKGHNNQN
jgi:hypothetical protein